MGQCKNCESNMLDVRVKTFSNQTKHLEEYCISCGAHQKYLPQDTEPILHFGKYKGQNVNELMKIDKPYCEWLLKNFAKGRIKKALEDAFKN